VETRASAGPATERAAVAVVRGETAGLADGGGGVGAGQLALRAVEGGRQRLPVPGDHRDQQVVGTGRRRALDAHVGQQVQVELGGHGDERALDAGGYRRGRR
jgi:hypothetical protein